MKNAFRLICLSACALLISNSSYAQNFGIGGSRVSDGNHHHHNGNQSRKAKLEKKAKKTARNILQKIRQDGDMYSAKELKQAIKAMNKVNMILGLPKTPIGGGHGGGGHHQGPVCSVEYVQGSYYNYYYVHKDGKKFSSAYSNFQDAVSQMQQFIQSGACKAQKQNKLDTCKVEYVEGSYYNYYYVYKKGEKYSGAYSNVSDAADFLNSVASARACKKPSQHEIKNCSIELIEGAYYNYYYVMQDGEKLSGAYSNFSDVDQFMAELQDASMCY